jgi:hypothetical protein
MLKDRVTIKSWNSKLLNLYFSNKVNKTMSDDELKETIHIKGIIKYFLLGLKGLLYIFHLVLR